MLVAARLLRARCEARFEPCSIPILWKTSSHPGSTCTPLECSRRRTRRGSLTSRICIRGPGGGTSGWSPPRSSSLAPQGRTWGKKIDSHTMLWADWSNQIKRGKVKIWPFSSLYICFHSLRQKNSIIWFLKEKNNDAKMFLAAKKLSQYRATSRSVNLRILSVQFLSSHTTTTI